MASTAHRTEEQKKEYFDTQEELDEKVNVVADVIFKSKYFIAFTGAGISTACGIADYRSGVNTVLPTGPGAWQKKAQKVKTNKKAVDMNKTVPSFTHMCLNALEKKGFLKTLISQNTDGLHMKSGFNMRKLIQLHGSRSLQICKKCKINYYRDYRTREANKTHDHQTSRKCEKCGKNLEDSILNFGEYYPEELLERAETEGEKADVCLAMGSSFYVKTASDIPRQVGNRGKLIVVNLQKTPLDEIAFVKVNALCENFMQRLAKKMELLVQDWLITRRIEFRLNKEMQMQIRGVQERGQRFSFIKELSIAYPGQKVFKKVNGVPFKVGLKKKEDVRIRLQFFGWNGEPIFDMKMLKQRQGIFNMIFDPQQKKWLSQKLVWEELPKKK